MRVTQADLLSALRDALSRPPKGDGVTTTEIAEQMGIRAPAVREVLKVFAASGKLEVVTLHRPAIDGRTMTLRGYRIKK